MKRFDSGEALAKEFGLSPSVLKKTFEDYNQVVRTQKDPFGKKVQFSSLTHSFYKADLNFYSSSKVNGSLMTSSTSPS